MFRVFEYLFEKTNVNLNVSNEDDQTIEKREKKFQFMNF